MSIPEFAFLFSGTLSEYGESFVLSDDHPPPFPGTALADRVFLERQLARFAAASYQGDDPKAVASVWSKAHFSTMLPPFMALMLLLQRSVDVRLEAIGCTFWPDGTLRHIHLPDTGRIVKTEEGANRFESLMTGHMLPLITALAAVSGVSKRVFWSNAGNVFDFAARHAQKMIGSNPAIADALSLLEERRLPDGRANPLHAPVRYHDTPEGPERRRRVCCIRYLIDQIDYCSTCPLTVKET
jgi:ferric iron reductase protein FhuF